MRECLNAIGVFPRISLQSSDRIAKGNGDEDFFLIER